MSLRGRDTISQKEGRGACHRADVRIYLSARPRRFVHGIRWRSAKRSPVAPFTVDGVRHEEIRVPARNRPHREVDVIAVGGCEDGG